MYFPTIAIVTSFVGLVWASVTLFQSFSWGFLQDRCSLSVTISSTFWRFNWIGILYIDFTSGKEITLCFSTLVNKAIFSLASSDSSLSDLQISKSGWRPWDNISLTDLCVGFVLVSPAAAM